MAITNQERVGKAMESLKDGLAPFAAREFDNRFKDEAIRELQHILGEPVRDREHSFHNMDAAALLKVMWDSWNDVYRDTLGHAERSLVSELRDVPQPLGTPGAILQRRHLPGARLHAPAVDRCFRAGGRRSRDFQDGVVADTLR